MAFKPATRKGTFALIGITGKSGGGKTYSAIRLARGLVGPNGKIGFIDTENGRGSHYSNLTRYDIDELWAPFSPARYAEKIREAAEAGFDALIIDSFSHEWEGTGGVLELAEATGKQGLQKWMRPKTEHKKLVNLILQTRMHIIVCLRGKEKLVQAKDDRGKDQIVSQGVVPIQEERFLYEMTVSLIMDEERPGIPTVRKCPADLLPAFPKGAQISERTGQMIAEWIGGGAPVDHEAESWKLEAREIAADGEQRLRAYWQQPMNKRKRAVLEPMLPELQSIARDADANQPPPDLAPGGDDDDVLDDAPMPPADHPALAEMRTHTDVQALVAWFNQLDPETADAIWAEYEAYRDQLAGGV